MLLELSDTAAKAQQQQQCWSPRMAALAEARSQFCFEEPVKFAVM